MSVRHAILGLLSWQPLAGYDLKKIFSESADFYWSGNNNQVYRTLLDLFEQGLVEREIIQQENLPAKKIYSITDKGRLELRQWLNTTPELPLLRNSFLVQLAWADCLSAAELDQLLNRYEEEIRDQNLMHNARGPQLPAKNARSPREAILWSAVHQNRAKFYQTELEWIQNLRMDLANQPEKDELKG